MSHDSHVQKEVRNVIWRNAIPIVTQYLHNSNHIVAYLHRLTAIDTYPWFYAERFVHDGNLNVNELKDDILTFLRERLA